jgi:acyl-CoA thioester hydrolase
VTHSALRVSAEYEVPFHDVDLLAVVWHGHYYKYMENGRTALFRAVDLDMADFIELGYKLLVIESRCRYVASLTYGDRFRVDSWFGDIDHRLMVSCEITNLTTGRRAARGRTAAVVMDGQGTMLLRTPEVIRERIQRAAAKEMGRS